MPKFRKKPVVIEAVRWIGTNTNEVLAFAPGVASYSDIDGRTVITIHTLEGKMTAQPGDWIIRGVQDEFYPCKPDIFDATYEATGGDS